MGRPMLIIIAGILVAIGIRQLGLLGTLGSMDQRSITYAESVQAKNNAYSGAEMALQEIFAALDAEELLNPNYQYSFDENITTVNISEDDEYINIRSVGKYNDELQGVRMTLWKGYMIEEEIIEGTLAELGQAMAITDEAILHTLINNPAQTKTAVGNFLTTILSPLCKLLGIGCPSPPPSPELGFQGTLDGNDASNTCEDEPGLVIPENGGFCSEYSGTIIGHIVCPLLDVLLGGGHGGILGDPIGKAIAENLNLNPVFTLIDNLETKSGVIRITEPVTELAGLGSPERPGVFFVENPLHLTGGEGYGIMIVRQTESTRLDIPLLLADNFTFHGLVIIDNIFTNSPNESLIQLPNIKGSLMVTNSSGIPVNPDDPNPIEIEIPEGTVIQYDCSTKEYIQRAIGPQIISVYEEGRIAA